MQVGGSVFVPAGMNPILSIPDRGTIINKAAGKIQNEEAAVPDHNDLTIILFLDVS